MGAQGLCVDSMPSQSIHVIPFLPPSHWILSWSKQEWIGWLDVNVIDGAQYFIKSKVTTKYLAGTLAYLDTNRYHYMHPVGHISGRVKSLWHHNLDMVVKNLHSCQHYENYTHPHPPTHTHKPTLNATTFANTLKTCDIQLHTYISIFSAGTQNIWTIAKEDNHKPLCFDK